MIVYEKENKPYFIFAILLVLLLISSPLNTKYYKSLLFNIYDKMLTYDMGFSSIPNLIGGDITDTEKYINILLKAPALAKNYLFGVDNRNNIDRLDVRIKFVDYKKILADRQKAIKNGIGYDFTQVKAKISFKDSEIKAKIRLKGDLSDHWRSIYKLSFRVNIKSNHSIFGYKTFSLQKPSARQHPYDQTFQELQRKLNNISPLRNYVHVFVNDQDWGIMDIEEHMSKELLEKQNFKASLIMKFGNEESWRYKRVADKEYTNYLLSDPRLNIRAYKEKKYLTEPVYRKWFSYIAKQRLEDDTSIYDIDSFSTTMLLAMSWNSKHTLSTSNSKYYFNPYTLKLLPITTDQLVFSGLAKPIPLPPIYQKLIKSNEFNENLEKNIRLVSEVLKSSQAVMDQYQSFFPMDETIDTHILSENIDKIAQNIHKYIETDSHIEKNNNSENIIAPTKNQANQLLHHIYARHFENGVIHIYNLLPDSIKLTKINVDGNRLPNIDTINIDGFTDKSRYLPLIIKTGLTGLFDNKITIDTEYQGYKRTYTLSYTHLVEGMHSPFDNIANHNNLEYLSKLNNNTWKIKKGSWNITQPLVINGNLVIDDDTVLSFSKNSYLIVKGSITAIAKSKIIFKAIEERWKGIYIINAKQISKLHNVIIKDTNALSDGLLNLTGAVNFYKSDVEIKDTQFINSIAEDSLNIVHSKFILDNITINESISDGLDSDFSTGKIVNSQFTNISGDGVDFSGSRVEILNSTFNNIHDKAVSSGEASNITVSNLTMDSIGVAVASKDGSNTVGKDIKISNYKMNALMTYVKKSFYNEPTLKLNNVSVDNLSKAFSRQKNTIMVVNGDEINAIKIDVKKMYKSGVMKK